ncbi:hypothetical protein F4779DRAFT_523954 [Xylariaceae sp. FL0662B]|nr:hypothetical protein F4779DRAFT_523954 [Xylariaceae sp. FL0662B]
MYRDYTFQIDDNVPQKNSKMGIPYRNPISTPVMQTLSPETSLSPSPESGSVEVRNTRRLRSGPAEPAASHMQIVFSSQTGETYSSQQHSSQEWESRKAEIRQLYLEENRPLKEVIAIMRQRGFRATVRMYKSRFEKWGFTKNNNKKDIITMLQFQRQRSAAGKLTTFHRNGKEVAIDAYLKRKGISQNELLEPGVVEKLPKNLRCQTPPPEVLQPPGNLSLQELILQCARDLAWNWYCPPETPLVACAAHYRGDELRCAITDLTNADWLFSVGQYEKGGAMCEEGFKSLHLMVKKPSIYGLLHLFLVVLDAAHKGVIKEIWRYLAAYAAAVRADGPLPRLFQEIYNYINTRDYDEYWNFLFECTEKLVFIDEHLTGLPPDTLPRLYPILCIPRSYRCRPQPYRRLQSRCDFGRLVQGAMPTAVEERTVFHATELLILGNQTLWQGSRVPELARAVLEGTRDIAYNTDFFNYIALTSMAHHHRNHYALDPAAHAASHPLSVHYLERVVALMEGRQSVTLGVHDFPFGHILL